MNSVTQELQAKFKAAYEAQIWEQRRKLTPEQRADELIKRFMVHPYPKILTHVPNDPSVYLLRTMITVAIQEAVQAAKDS